MFNYGHFLTIWHYLLSAQAKENGGYSTVAYHRKLTMLSTHPHFGAERGIYMVGGGNMSEQGQTNTREIAKCVYSISAGGGSTQKHARRCRSAVGLVFLSDPQRRRTQRFSGPGYDNKRFRRTSEYCKTAFHEYQVSDTKHRKQSTKERGLFRTGSEIR